MPKKGFFITFEGTDGVGKSTQARETSQWLTKQGFDNILTREPGGGIVSEKIRTLLLDPKNKMQPMTELLLYQAARVEHIENIILPTLAKGITVICDRFTDATIAYQGYARRLQEVEQLNNLVCKSLKPDITILLDLPPERGLKNAQERGKIEQEDRIEQEGLTFQVNVRDGYLDLAKKDGGKRIHLINVKSRIEETQVDIQKILGPLFHGNSRTSARD